MLTKEELDAIRERDKKATPGPWTTDDDEVMLAYEPDHKRTYMLFNPPQANRFVCCLDDGEYHEYEDRTEARANGEFIAHAREDIPRLLDHIDAITDALRGAREALDRIQQAAANGFFGCDWCEIAYHEADAALEGKEIPEVRHE